MLDFKAKMHQIQMGREVGEGNEGEEREGIGPQSYC